MSDWIENTGVMPDIADDDVVTMRFIFGSQQTMEGRLAKGLIWEIDRPDTVDILSYRIVPAVGRDDDRTELRIAHARIEELERKIGTLIEENQALRERLAAPRMPRVGNVVTNVGADMATGRDRTAIVEVQDGKVVAVDGKPAWLEQVAAEEVTSV